MAVMFDECKVCHPSEARHKRIENWIRDLLRNGEIPNGTTAIEIWIWRDRISQFYWSSYKMCLFFLSYLLILVFQNDKTMTRRRYNSEVSGRDMRARITSTHSFTRVNAKIYENRFRIYSWYLYSPCLLIWIIESDLLNGFKMVSPDWIRLINRFQWCFWNGANPTNRVQLFVSTRALKRQRKPKFRCACHEIINYVPRRTMRVIARRATMLAADRS